MTRVGAVILEPYEVAMAAHVGIARWLNANLHGYQSPMPRGESWTGLQRHIVGALGEVAYAKLNGVHWDGSVGTFKRPDVGDVEVRTRCNLKWDLPVHSSDHPDVWLELVVTDLDAPGPPELVVVGGIRAKDARRPEWYRGHPDGRTARWSHWVPQGALR